jgi:hypothetical protein
MVKNGTRSGRARFRCAKGREYKPQANPEAHESKRRKTSTQFTGCKFQLAARPAQRHRGLPVDSSMAWMPWIPTLKMTMIGH